MNFVLDENSSKPAYLQIYNELKQDIINGIFAFNSKLPSKRVMAEKFNVSTITIEHSYALLCEEGYVASRERQGFFVIFKSGDGFVHSSAFLEESTINENKSLKEKSIQFPLSVLSKTMRKVINEYGQNILLKAPNKGNLELRSAIKQYLAQNRGMNVNIEQIVIGSGAEYLYNQIVGVLGRNRIFALENPSYEKIQQIYLSFGVTCDLLPLKSNGIDSNSLQKTNASVLHVSPYRSYPTGITASASKRHEYINWSSIKDRFIVEDDFESEFSVSTKPEETIFSLSPYDNVIYLNTFSKTISPAIRAGYMVLPEKLLNDFDKKLGFYTCTVPVFEQIVLAKLISSGDFERHINRVRRIKRKSLLD